jgi:DNA polymerase-3 subunit delta
VLNVARYDVFKLSEAVLAGHPQRVQRMLDGLQAEGEAEVLVHYTLAEDIRALKRVKDAMASGRPLPMALREQRVWGPKERCSSACCRGWSPHAGQPAARRPPGGRHRQGLEGARLARRRLAGLAALALMLCLCLAARRPAQGKASGWLVRHPSVSRTTGVG